MPKPSRAGDRKPPDVQREREFRAPSPWTSPSPLAGAFSVPDVGQHRRWQTVVPEGLSGVGEAAEEVHRQVAACRSWMCRASCGTSRQRHVAALARGSTRTRGPAESARQGSRLGLPPLAFHSPRHGLRAPMLTSIPARMSSMLGHVPVRRGQAQANLRGCRSDIGHQVQAGQRVVVAVCLAVTVVPSFVAGFQARDAVRAVLLGVHELQTERCRVSVDTRRA